MARVGNKRSSGNSVRIIISYEIVLDNVSSKEQGQLESSALVAVPASMMGCLVYSAVEGSLAWARQVTAVHYQSQLLLTENGEERTVPMWQA